MWTGFKKKKKIIDVIIKEEKENKKKKNIRGSCSAGRQISKTTLWTAHVAKAQNLERIVIETVK